MFFSACPFTTKLSIKPLQRTSTRNSVEGLNQEIERIVLKTDSDIHTCRNDDFNKSSLITPEGHRAPLAEILRQSRSRSVNTQTPQDFDSFTPSSGMLTLYPFNMSCLRKINEISSLHVTCVF